MQLQSYVHSRKQYIIHCMQWHFCRRQQLQFWSLDQMRVMGSELPVRPCTQWWDCWSMASRRGYCNDAFHREEWWCLLVSFGSTSLLIFTSRSLRWKANCQEGRYWIQVLANLFSEPWPVTKVIANEDIYGGMHRLLTQDGDRKRLRERTRLMHPVHYFQEWQMLLAWHFHF